jgi:[protein-PII] uridylyltransferase
VWNQWRARLLHELYVKARAQLLGEVKGADGATLKEAFITRWRRLLGDARAEAFAKQLPERYFLSTSPEHAVLHARMLDRARRTGFAAAIRSAKEIGGVEVTLCAKDRPGLLALFAGVLSAHGLNILAAQIVSTGDGLALDVFTVRPSHGGALEHSRWRKARADLKKVVEDQAQVADILRKHRSGLLLRRPLPRVETQVTVDNKASARFTVLDVLAQDRVGLLYAIARALYEVGAQIAVAKVATEAHRAIDSFYVTAGGQKIEEPEAVERMMAAVRTAVDTLEG